MACCSIAAVLLLATAPHIWAADPFSVSLKVTPLSAQPGQRVAVESAIRIAPDHYLYKSEAGLDLHAQPGFQFVPAPMPPPVTKQDPFLNKKIEIYENALVLRGEVAIAETVKPGDYTLEFETRYQGCSHTSCFLPDSQVDKVRIKVVPAGSMAASATPAQPRTKTAFETALDQGRIFYALILCFVSGILVSLTPCCYPLIPITVGVIAAGSLGRRGKGFMLSVAYVLGISITYALLGAIAASAGKLFGSLGESPWVAGLVTLVFLGLSLSMFGLYEMPMFAGLSERYQGRTGTGLPGVFVMGLVAGLVASPCVCPVLASLLVYISTTGSVLVGFLMMFVMAWGMGVLLIVVGTFSGAVSLLPRSGEWMVLVKHVLGLIMLAGAFYYFKNIVSWPVFLIVLGGALSVLGVFAGGKNHALESQRRGDVFADRPAGPAGLNAGHAGLPIGKNTLVRVYQTFGSVSLVVGVCLIMQVVLPQAKSVPATGIPWILSEQEGLAKAKAEGKPAMMDFWADWCAACVHLDRTTYANPDVIREAQRFVPIKVDCTNASSASVKALLGQYRVVGLPTILFIDRKGQWLQDKTVNEYIGAPELLAIMRSVP